MGKKGKGGGGGEIVKEEQGLQAVVLADSFTNTFKPLSYDTPKVSLSLDCETRV